MASLPDRAVLRELAAIYHLGALRELTDGQLLERFVRGPGAAADHAFAALVERHGGLVLGVCRGVLADPNDAADAFQATFLVLVVKARSLWVRDSLGPWLHQVALRTAQAARAATHRRRRVERAAAENRPLFFERESADESAHHLHAEIARLPERFRAPLILCDLEGQPLEQAARHLGVPVGTVKSRLSRARARLRPRLEPLRAGEAADRRPPAPVPPALALATLRAAGQAAASGPAALAPTLRHLVSGGILAMSFSRWAKLAATAAVSLTTLSGAGLLALAHARGQDDDGPKAKAAPAAKADAPVTAAKTGPFRQTISERGSLESATRGYGIDPLPGQTAILSILPEGTRVTKGQEVARLDTSGLRDEVAVQRVAVQAAERALAEAERAQQLAALAVEEYDKGLVPVRRNAFAAEAALAEKTLQAAQERETRTRAAFQVMEGSVARLPTPRTPESLLAELDLRNRLDDATLGVLHARAAVDRVGQERKAFDQFTHPKTLANLRAAADRAAAEVVARRGPVESARERVASLERRIASATLRAPNDGFVVYASDKSRPGGFVVEEGAVVRERQVVFRVDDMAKIVMNAKVHESMVDQVRPGQAGTVTIDAFPGRTYRGTVKSVAPLPDPSIWAASSAKVYSTWVELDRTDPDLRPGMTAAIDLVLKELPEALTIPTTAVLLVDGRTRVGLREPDGSFRLRDVVVGPADETSAVIRSGLKAGDEVHLRPAELLSAEERERLAPSKETPKKAARPSPAFRKRAAMPIAPEVRQKLLNVDLAVRVQLQAAGTPEERARLLKTQGLTDAEIAELERLGLPAPPPERRPD